ncbi:MAG: 50S ribosomal protein L9 [Candidatus Moraniibacteriota bacterium]|nr:MAG: 50S ribosomal protein L9 [Candidatus Moranbacteria bacterium]
MQTKVVFTKTIDGVAKVGDIRLVSAGYARNFLFPKNLAEPGTERALLNAKKRQADETKKENDIITKVKEESQALREREVRIAVREKDGTMFGSVTAKDIVKALEKDGVVISEKNIVLPKPLKTLGEHELTADFGHGISVPFVVLLKGE